MIDQLERGECMDLVRMEMDKALKSGHHFTAGASGRICDLYQIKKNQLGAIERIQLLKRLVIAEVRKNA